MSNQIEPSMDALPVEVLHMIFDHLDTETLLLGVRPVCRAFCAVINTYDRFILDLRLISKCNFFLLCRLINPKNVISLKLSDDEITTDQISTFISLVRLPKFTRLHSIVLNSIREEQFNTIFKRIQLDSLQSVSVHIVKHDDRRKKTTCDHLSTLMATPSLRKVRLNIRNDRISHTTWPSYCTIESLTLDESVTFPDLSRIVSCSPQLKKLTINGYLSSLVREMTNTVSFSQLISLTIEKVDVSIDQFESFLLLTPSLVDLKFLTGRFLLDGKRWEQFLQIHLPNLEKFQFFCESYQWNSPNRDSLELMLEPFRGPFWTEHKKWFVALSSDWAGGIRFFSIPMCKSAVRHRPSKQKTYVSTSGLSFDEDPSVTSEIDELTVPWEPNTDEDTINKEVTKSNLLFPNVIKLEIDFDDNISLNLLRSLSSFIEITKLMKVKLQSSYFGKRNINVLYEVINLLQQASNLAFLTIRSRHSSYGLYPFLDHIRSFIPRQIKSLQIPINDVTQIGAILDRCPYLVVLHLLIRRVKLSNAARDWFTEHTSNSTYQRQSDCDVVWLGKKITRIDHNPKRIKLMNDEP